VWLVIALCLIVEAAAGPKILASDVQAAQQEADLAAATWPGAVPSDILLNQTCKGPDGIVALPLSRGCSAYGLCCEWSSGVEMIG
jgi:hypothetical protein